MSSLLYIYHTIFLLTWKWTLRYYWNSFLFSSAKVNSGWSEFSSVAHVSIPVKNKHRRELFPFTQKIHRLELTCLVCLRKPQVVSYCCELKYFLLFLAGFKSVLWLPCSCLCLLTRHQMAPLCPRLPVRTVYLLLGWKQLNLKRNIIIMLS